MVTRIIICLACVLLLLSSFRSSSAENASIVTSVQPWEQSFTLTAGKLSVRVLIPPVARSSEALLHLELLATPPGSIEDTGVRISIVANQAVTLTASPSFRVEGIEQGADTRSFFMRLTTRGNNIAEKTFVDLLPFRIVTDAAPSESVVTLTGLRGPLPLVSQIQYDFSLVASPLPVSNSASPRSGSSSGPNVTGTLYVANSLTGTIVSFSLPLPPGTGAPPNPANLISTPWVLSHGLVVYDSAPVNSSGVPSNETFVNATNCTTSLTCSNTVFPAVLAYPKGGGTATQYQIAYGPIITGIVPGSNPCASPGPPPQGFQCSCPDQATSTNPNGEGGPLVVSVNGTSDYICYGPALYTTYNGTTKPPDVSCLRTVGLVKL